MTHWIILPSMRMLMEFITCWLCSKLKMITSLGHSQLRNINQNTSNLSIQNRSFIPLTQIWRTQSLVLTWIVKWIRLSPSSMTSISWLWGIPKSDGSKGKIMFIAILALIMDFMKPKEQMSGPYWKLIRPDKSVWKVCNVSK